MIPTPNIQTLTNPKLLDLAIDEIGLFLKANLTWLDSAYGKVQKIKDSDNQQITKGSNSRLAVRSRITPNVILSTNDTEDYMCVFPSDTLGNFCYFECPDTEPVKTIGGIIRIEAKVGIVFWYDLREVYPADWKSYTNDNVKSDVANLLNRGSFKNVTKIEDFNFHNTPDKIYSGYTHTEIEDQFLMRPFGGFRLDINMRVQSQCDIGVGPIQNVGLNINPYTDRIFASEFDAKAAGLGVGDWWIADDINDDGKSSTGLHIILT